jgi:hypothetical protein
LGGARCARGDVYGSGAAPALSDRSAVRDASATLRSSPKQYAIATVQMIGAKYQPMNGTNRNG